MMNDLSWDLLRDFLAVAEAGSLTRAAEMLRSSQPTVGRHVAALEAQLGVALLIRSPSGVALTEAGRALAARATRLAAELGEAVRAVRGEAGQVRGRVRIAASPTMGALVLPPILAALQARHAGLTIELDVDVRASDLLTAQADVAVRMYAPEQLDLVRRRVGAIPTGLFASRDYVARRGAPASLDAVLAEGHGLIGFDRSAWGERAYRSLDARITRETLTFRADDAAVQLEAARAGLGILPMQRPLARRFPELVEVLPTVPLPDLPVWVVAHRDVRDAPAVQVIFDGLVEGLLGWIGADGAR